MWHPQGKSSCPKFGAEAGCHCQSCGKAWPAAGSAELSALDGHGWELCPGLGFGTSGSAEWLTCACVCRFSTSTGSEVTCTRASRTHGLCEQVGHPVPTQDGQLLWEETFDFLSISAAVYALRRGKKGRTAVAETEGCSQSICLDIPWNPSLGNGPGARLCFGFAPYV